ncbi:MAG: nucleotidyltransferase family protein [Hyphomicrobiales bacterium]
MNDKLFSQLESLSTLIRPQLGLPFDIQNISLNQDLVSYAIHRHRVGPILYKALEQICATKNSEQLRLEQSYRENVRAILTQRATSKKLIALLESEAIPFTFLKGWGLARQLYDDPNSRQSKDIDILIPKTASASAIRLFNEKGYVHQPSVIRKRRSFSESRQISDMKRLKDQTFADLKFSTMIELHERLFKIEPDGLISNFNEAVGFERYPSINNVYYCFYFILHGALALWPRLKWVVDLSLLVRKLRSHDRNELLRLANEYGCEASILASLRLVQDIFPGSLDEEWFSILAKKGQDESVKKIAGIFFEALSSSAPSNQSLSAKRPILSDSSHLVFGRRIGILNVVRLRVLNAIAIRV